MSVTTSQITLPFRCRCCRSIRVHIRADAIFARERENGDIMHVPAYFGTRPQDINKVRDVDIDNIARELSDQVERRNSRGSVFIIGLVNSFIICVTKFRPLHGSLYIPTPKRIADKHCTVNVKKRSKMFCMVGGGVPISYQ